MRQASVIIPTHNRPHFLRAALQSVVDQEGVDLDIIVIGDGAGEETAAVVAGFPSVRYVTQQQSGPNVARNRAVELARFDCIAMLDDDDVWLPGKMRTQLEILDRQPDAGYVFSDFHILREGRPLMPQGLSTWGIPASEWRQLLGKPAAGLDTHSEGRTEYYRVELYTALLEHPYVLPTTAVFRKSFLTPEIRFVDHDFICGDWEFFARLSRLYPAIFMPIETACNRSHDEDGRLTRTPDHIQLQRRLEMLDRLWGADDSFLADSDNRALLNRIKYSYLLTLAKHHLRNGSWDSIMRAFELAQAIHPKLPADLRTIKLIASMPAGLACLRYIDKAILKARRVSGRR